ncbi:Alpha/Beta hydrolase protein [Ilyonectria robusta]|uniref:Alpha/Beta hydrolase protein n=1 Tax=Ilyonectria robusta TaxID=1079257 RepID=UPI001E8DB534|nr:Alpha/Beta hydrolase protein [Ilyonectria robusta]KAH8734514.1 Alpha/Beta hydrolase protein [Ilyonectria robusta]
MVQGPAAFVKCRSSDTEIIVDLGYSVHKGVFNASNEYYSFKNIRYGEPPVGALRWNPPIAPRTINRTLDDGGVQRICPQAYPRWLLQPRAEAAGIPVETMVDFLMNDQRVSEDCLFLDVHVPSAILAQKGEKGSGAAVMVWIHGGGYDIGFKDQAPFDSPAGLLARSQFDDQEGIIFISINYRLGMFGFLYNDGADMIGNAAFWDQRLALEWVQKYAHLFGGDRHRITIIGESAGGGSVLHQVTAFGGRGKAPFAAAISQSPAIPITANTSEIWQTTIAEASRITAGKITTVQQLRQLNSSALMQINQAAVFGSGYGLFTYGPLVDRLFVPALPGVLLLNGQFYHDVKIMTGYNKNESGMFIPTIRTNEDLSSFLQVSYPMSDSARDFVLSELYPNILDGTYGYTTQAERTRILIDDMVFTCNTRFLAAAFQNETYGYRFEYPPGLHGQDLAWTFFKGDDPAVLPELAIAMQRYLTNFAMTGTPNGEVAEDLPSFPLYGEQANLAIFGIDGVSIAQDATNHAKCDFWQKGVF